MNTIRPGGSGKNYVLNTIINYMKLNNIYITAATQNGIAAKSLNKKKLLIQHSKFVMDKKL